MANRWTDRETKLTAENSPSSKACPTKIGDWGWINKGVIVGINAYHRNHLLQLAAYCHENLCENYSLKVKPNYGNWFHVMGTFEKK